MEQALFAKTGEYKRLLAGADTPGTAALFGLPPAGRAQMLAALARDTGRPLCVVTPGEAEATHFAADLNTLGIAAAVFPARDLVLRPIEGTGREYEYRRLAVLGDLAGGRLQAVCLPAEAFLQYTVPREDFRANTLTLKPGTVIPSEQLIARLYGAGYHRRDKVEGPGQFSVRGGIVDLFAPDMRQPARIEYWDDEIDTIRSFDLLTQRRDENLKKIFISPAREVLFGDAAQTASALREFLSQRKGAKKEKLAEVMQVDLAALDGGLMPEAMDKYYSVRYPAPGLLIDHLDDPILVLDELSGIRDADRATQFRRREEVRSLLESGALTGDLAELWPEEAVLLQAAQQRTSIACENFTRSMPDVKLKEIVDAPAHALPGWSGELSALTEDLQSFTRQGYAVTVLAGTARAAAALAKDLTDRGFSATSARDAVAAPGLVNVLPGQMTGGCEYPFARYALITGRRQADAEGKRRPAKKAKDALASLSDIKPGDYVVHQNHGIGLYQGIKRIDLQGVVKDYLQINYDKGDVLYVPVTQLDLLSRYSTPGEDNSKKAIKLSRLGGQEWAKTRRKVKTATAEMAKELITLYAKRHEAKGYAFPCDDDWQHDFETRFAYDETPDQLSSASEIKHDMEQPWPMDRLLCGDVGVGKTEVALRAAFKCVMGGKQCAILAPTTLLAWQHYNTILSRMEAFPIKCELLSRFRSAGAIRDTIAHLKTGDVDIVVGTHRLLSDDVKFKNLGLVIIDEEQRFGVKHKEKLKEAFIGVDMLTLSATPIPRTLNMAMSGIRDMSTIEQPPFERQPIETYVLEYDAVILAEALKKELARGGQAYYLYNRVDSIYQCAEKVSAMVPGARIGVAHGKMTEAELSKVWKQLLENEIDILVCTTLIETGIDVRNCNTLVIEDADRMGLSQLYQIRGRVGRSGRKAYAYFTFRRDKVLTEVAEKRLSAIREFTSFGSGFRIAMRDLQIRGAGSLLGHSQHGHMQSVGYELYIKMLNQAIALAKGESPAPDKSDCLVDITVDAYIPETYIPDPAGRIEAYKRIAAIQSAEDTSDVLDELIDRYGEPPDSVNGLLDVSLVRVTAANAGFTEITQRGDMLLLYSEALDVEKMRPLLAALPGRVMMNTKARPYVAVRVANGEKPLEVLRRALTPLIQQPQPAPAPETTA